MDTFPLEPHIRYYLVDCCNAFAAGKGVSGWKRKDVGKHRKVEVWVNKTLELVLKRNNFVLCDACDMPEDVVLPTLELSDTDDAWWAQPLVKIKDRKKAEKLIQKRLKNYRCYPDVTLQNVGWYKGKPYLFDW
jgi:hypothetical protein